MRGVVKMLVASVLFVVLATILVGCGGGNDQSVYQNVYDRPSWNPTDTRLAFTSIGGNALFYIYSINSNGGSLVLLTQSKNNANDLSHEGGRMPVWSPDGTDIAMSARRGGGSWSLYLIDPINGSNSREVKLTDSSRDGSDLQASWAPDSTKLLYITDKYSDHFEMYTVLRNGTGNARVIDLPYDAQWPVFSPDGTKIAFQKGIGSSTTGVDTDVMVLDLATMEVTNLTANNGGADFRDEAPSWSADGTRIAFHSNRLGDFDIFTMAADGSGLSRLTSDARSDGFPSYSKDGLHIGFVRDRELWSMNPDGSNQKQLTRRY